MSYDLEDPGNYEDPESYYQEELDKTPHSMEAEQAIIGTLLYDNLAVYSEISEVVQPKHFYNPVHVTMMERIYALSRRGQKCDPIILKNRLQRHEMLEEIGGVEYIGLLADQAPPTVTARNYADLVLDMAGRREIIRLARSAIEDAFDQNSDLDAMEQLEALVSNVGVVQEMAPADAQFITLQEAAKTAVDAIGVERPMGLPIGIPALEEKIRGAGRGKLISVLGRPSMGKTSLAFAIAKNVAKSIGIEDGENVPGKVGFFSQEMPAEELGERAASSALGVKGGIEYRDISAHNVKGFQKDQLLNALDKLPESFLIDETAGLTFSQIEKRARAMRKRLGGLDMIVVDYLQLMETSDSPDPRNDVKAMGWICNQFKTMAKDMDICVVLLSQLARRVEDRENKRPRMADGKGAGGIEDASDIMLGIYREEHYLIEAGEPSDPKKVDEYMAKLEFAHNKMEVIVMKNKGGPKGKVMLRAFLPYDVITDLSDEDGTGYTQEMTF